MIEKIILDYLSEKLSCPVVMERDGETAPFVLLSKTGGSRYNRINTATFAIQSYGVSLYDSAVLNEEVKSAIDNMIELDIVSKCSLNSDYNFTDTSTKEYRYQALYDITYLMEV